MKNKEICIAYATDSNYINPTCVSIYSLLKNSDADNMYSINVIIPSEVSQRERDIIKKVCGNFENCSLNFVVFTDELVGVESVVAHISNITYYRLLLHKYLENFDKCIWLDSDTIICSDISELYEFEIGDNYIAGVKAPAYQLAADYHCKRLKIPSIEGYINAGILVVNMKKLRENQMEYLFLELSKRNYADVDQSVINVACYGKILHLNFKFNFQPSRLYESNKDIFKIFDPHEIAQAYTNPTVVHFLDAVKPWQDLSYDFNNCWINSYTELAKILPEISGFYSAKDDRAESILDYIDIKNAEKLVFYGAGAQGRNMVEYLKFLEIKMPDEIWDINAENFSDAYGISVVTPKFNGTIDYLKSIALVICIENHRIVQAVREQSEKVGIAKIYTASDLKKSLRERAKIIWERLIADVEENGQAVL